MKKKILVIDENETNRKLYCYVLKTVDADIIMAINGKDALQKIHQTQYDLVLMETQLHDISGKIIIKKIRNESRLNRIFVCTISSEELNENDMKSIGCDYALSKPINTRVFPLLIHQFLEKTMITS